MKILLVEDNAIIGFDVSSRLEELGCEIIGPLATAQQALEVVRDSSLNGAILDYSIRGGTSEPIAKALRNRQCPFAYMTGYNVLPPSADGIPRLDKPVRTSDLVVILDYFRCIKPSVLTVVSADKSE